MMIFEIDKPVVDEKPQDITVNWLLENEEVWQQANPNIDVSVQRDALVDALKEAQQYGGTTERECLTLNFNCWVNSADSFIPADVFNKNTFGLELEEGETCYAGVQIGPTGSLSAVALLFPGEVNKIKMLWMIAEEDLKTNDLYNLHRDLIKVDPGNVLDTDVATGWIIEEFQKYNLHSFCFPKTQVNNSVIQNLIKAGYEGNPIAEALGSISTPTDAWEKMLRSTQVEHFSDPILKWQNSNCLAVRKEAGTRLEKNGKVLGIWACVLAVAQWQTVGANGGSSSVEIW
jgi:phage terminase large subunit-like protein